MRILVKNTFASAENQSSGHRGSGSKCPRTLDPTLRLHKQGLVPEPQDSLPRPQRRPLFTIRCNFNFLALGGSCKTPNGGKGLPPSSSICKALMEGRNPLRPRSMGFCKSLLGLSDFDEVYSQSSPVVKHFQGAFSGRGAIESAKEENTATFSKGVPRGISHPAPTM